jgi:hypothetical protein
MILLSGCASSNRVVVKQKELPVWYTQPPVSNNTDLYAIGDGKNKQDAISNALSMLVSTLSVSISSKFSAKSIVREGRVNSSDATYTNETQSETKKVRISSYEVLNTSELGFRKYAVLVKVNKQKLFNSLEKETQQKFEIIENKEKIQENKNALDKLFFYKESLESLQNLPNTLTVMSVLNEGFDTKPYLDKYDALDRKYESYLKNITFWVDSNYKPLVSPVSKGLSHKNIKIKNVSGVMHFHIYIKANIQKAAAYGFSLARANISITTKDSQLTTIATNSINLVGQSSQGYEIAKQDLVNKLNKLIQNEGIAKVLNINI